VRAAAHRERPDRALVLGMRYHYLSQSQARACAVPSCIGAYITRARAQYLSVLHARRGRASPRGPKRHCRSLAGASSAISAHVLLRESSKDWQQGMRTAEKGRRWRITSSRGLSAELLELASRDERNRPRARARAYRKNAASSPRLLSAAILKSIEEGAGERSRGPENRRGAGLNLILSLSSLGVPVTHPCPPLFIPPWAAAAPSASNLYPDAENNVAPERVSPLRCPARSPPLLVTI